MKKFVFVLLIFTVLFGKAFAQENEFVDVEIDTSIPSALKTNEVYVTAGSTSFVGLFSGVFYALATAIANSNTSPEDRDNQKSDAPAFSLSAGYNHFFWNAFGVGGFVNYENALGLNILTFQAKLTGQYGFEHFKFYHSISGGILCVPGTDGVAPVFDVTLLGLKLDFDQFNIFVETCMPSTALLKIGASYKF